MTIILTQEKKDKIFNLCIKAMNNTIITIRSLASLIGNFIYYKSLERIKTKALINSKGDFDAKTEISTGGITELEWWTNNIRTATRSVKIPNIDMTIY